MPSRLPSRFSLPDAMILIAATALGGRGLQMLRSTLNISHFAGTRDGRPFLAALIRVPHLINAPAPPAAAWTVAVLVIGRGSARRRLIGEPGPAACLAATVGPAITALQAIVMPAVQIATIGGPDQRLLNVLSWETIGLALIARPSGVGIAVAAVWTCPAIRRRRRPQRIWIDRLGRALGLYWLLMIFWVHLLEALMLTRVLTFAPSI